MTKIDDYIKHLELQKRGLTKKYRDMQETTDKNLKTGTDPLFNEKFETREKIKNVKKELEFMKKFREAQNEMLGGKKR